MQTSKLFRRVAASRVAAVSIGAAVVVTLGGTGAVAAGLITSAQIKNGAVHGVDLASSSVGSSKIANGSVGADDLAPNSVGSSELSGPLMSQINSGGLTGSPNWGVVDRQVLGDGQAYLRLGPNTNTLGPAGFLTPPLGDGSLAVQTGAGQNQAAFGNEVGFNNDLVSSLTTLGFTVFTTTENNDRGAHNMPSIAFEIDPNLNLAPGDDVEDMVYTPPNGHADRWTAFDATDNTQGTTWTLSGPAGRTIGCNPGGTGCTWDQIQNRLEDRDGNPATIYTLMITKTPGFAFSGAVDALRVRDRVYDFEAQGVNLVP
jgi:hypothetical protein